MFKKKKKKVLRNQRGQGMLEYVMLLAVVAAIVLAFRERIQTAVGNLTDGAVSQAESVINN